MYVSSNEEKSHWFRYNHWIFRPLYAILHYIVCSICPVYGIPLIIWVQFNRFLDSPPLHSHVYCQSNSRYFVVTSHIILYPYFPRLLFLSPCFLRISWFRSSKLWTIPFTSSFLKPNFKSSFCRALIESSLVITGLDITLDNKLYWFSIKKVLYSMK